MPKKSKKSKKRTKPNVFAQNTSTTKTNEENLSEPNNKIVIEKQNKKIAVETIPSNYFSREIRKMGVIATSMVAIIAILTIVLG